MTNSYASRQALYPQNFRMNPDLVENPEREAVVDDKMVAACAPKKRRKLAESW